VCLPDEPIISFGGFSLSLGLVRLPVDKGHGAQLGMNLE
jgi:hypothetical protein